ncbi:MAG: DUF1573 domain-containing protein [Candidatus Kapabacteria bacterium]|nr:DUF1573 domain-containing protein [Candidatus Kapabacteria bacterium]
MKYVFTLALLCIVATSAFAQPKLEIVGGETYDWGRVTVKQNPLKMVTLDADVVLKNTGNQTLIIDTVKVGCGCTTPTLESKTIEPGGTTKLKIGLNVGLNQGEMTKNLTIYSNSSDDPNKSGKLMFLKTNIIRPLSITPQSLSFPEIKVGETATGSVTFKNNDSKPISIRTLLPTKGIKLNQRSFTINPGDTMQVKATYTGTERGYYNAMVYVEVEDPDFTPFEISAYGNVKGADGSDDPSVIKIDPSKAKDGKIELTPPGAAPAAAPAPKKKGK